VPPGPPQSSRARCQCQARDARHTAGTFLGLLGVAPRAAMEMMGWSSSEMLIRYGHATDAMRADTARRIGEHLRPPVAETPEDGAEEDSDDRPAQDN
jgi:integrase